LAHAAHGHLFLKIWVASAMLRLLDMRPNYVAQHRTHVPVVQRVEECMHVWVRFEISAQADL
jgi:hypothetical protein